MSSKWAHSRWGIREYGGMRFLVQHRAIFNAFGADVPLPFKPPGPSQQRCPHDVKIPTHGETLPVIDHPLFKVMLPIPAEGVYVCSQQDLDLIGRLTQLFSPVDQTVFPHWMVNNSMMKHLCMQTNLCPLVITDFDFAAVSKFDWMTRMARTFKRRVIYTGNSFLPKPEGGEQLTCDLDLPEAYTAEALQRIGNVALTQYMLEKPNG